MRNSHLVLAGALFLGGCFYFPSLPTTTNGSIVSAIISNHETPNAVINVLPSFTDGGYQTQAVVTKYTRNSINHVTFKLFKLGTNNSETLVSNGEKEVLLGDIDSGTRFEKLVNDTTYRIRAYAYKATGSLDADLISHPASADIMVTNDTQPNDLSLNIKLIDIPFSAQASVSGVTFTDGDFTYPASESLE
jgi:hypothetical protein